MSVVAADDYASQTQHVIFPDDIDNRINELKKTIRESQQEGDDPFDDDVEECDALRRFRAEVERVTGFDFDAATLVPGSMFGEHAQDYAESVADIDFLSPFVDWERFADSLKSDYTALDFGDDTVYVKN